MNNDNSVMPNPIVLGFTVNALVTPEEANLVVSLTILKELRAMAQISDQKLADLQAAAQANADRDAVLGGKVDAAVQLITDLKAIIADGSTSADAQIQAVTDLLNGATAQAVTAEDKLDAAVAPPAPATP